jgi:hypothetical protein
MKSLGDFDLSTVIYGKFTTFRPSTGAAYTLGGTPALSVYKDNSTTQSTTGVTLTADFDSVTGLNHFAIDTSADGSFYSTGSFFDIVITTGTVDSVSVVGSVVASFTLRKNSALKPTTAGRTLVVDASGLADANAVKLGPTGSGTAQTARDLGASVLLSTGTGTGQLDFTSGVVKANATQLLGTAWLTPSVAGTPDVNLTSSAIKTLRGFTAVTYISTSDSAKTIIEAASAGTLCILAPGTHALGANQIVQPAGVAVIGAGRDLTTVTSTLTAGSGTNAEIIWRPGGDNILIQDLTIKSLNTTESSFDIPLGLASGTVNGAVFRNLRVIGLSDGTYFKTTSGICTATLENIIVETKFDGGFFYGSAGSQWYLKDVIYNCTEGNSSASAQGLEVRNTIGDNVTVIVKTRVSPQTSTLIAMRAFGSTTQRTVFSNSRFMLVGDASTTNYSVFTTGSEAVRLIDCEYDRDKTGGLITDVFSPLRPSVANRTLVVDAAGLADANAVKVGPTGAGTAQTAADVGLKASYLPSVTAGAAGGVFIAGTNAQTTITSGFGANSITSTSIATDTITDAKVASDVTIASVTGAVGSVTGAVGSVTGFTAADVAIIKGYVDDIGVAGAGLTALAPASTALSNAVWTPTKAGYIDAAISGVSTGGVSAGAIADAVWDETRSGHVNAGTFGLYLDAAVSDAGGGGGTLSDPNGEPVSIDRTFVLEQKGSGLTGSLTKAAFVGSNVLYAVDFRNDIAANDWITEVEAPTIVSGTEGGVTFGDPGRDGSQAKVKIHAVTAGTYVLQFDVTYHSGNTQTGRVTFKAVQ